MTILDETRFIERLQFFNGQRLFASDIQGIEAFNREMRWLHNKSLHQPGIGSGFAVTGKKGDRQITIGAGYAIDALGREIVLTQDYIEPIPPVAKDDKAPPGAKQNSQSVFYDLTVSFPDDTELEEAETREGVCLPMGVIRLREEPIFCWVRLQRDVQNNLHTKKPKLQKDIKDGLKIILARIEVFNCQLNQPVSIAERRSARPVTQPYIASGRERPNWDLNDDLFAIQADAPVMTIMSGMDSPQPITLKAKALIDTSSGGFLTVPNYSVNITGKREKIISTMEGAASSGSNVFVFDRFFIENTRSDGIDIVGLIIAIGPVDKVKELIQSWELVWMGVEG